MQLHGLSLKTSEGKHAVGLLSVNMNSNGEPDAVVVVLLTLQLEARHCCRVGLSFTAVESGQYPYTVYSSKFVLY